MFGFLRADKRMLILPHLNNLGVSISSLDHKVDLRNTPRVHTCEPRASRLNMSAKIGKERRRKYNAPHHIYSMDGQGSHRSHRLRQFSSISSDIQNAMLRWNPSGNGLEHPWVHGRDRRVCGRRRGTWSASIISSGSNAW